jgi:hypothetical protein
MTLDNFVREPVFYNVDGSLTLYALRCGYQEVFEASDIDRKRLYMEHNTFHVQGLNNGERFWESFDTLKQARKFYKSIKFEAVQ